MHISESILDHKKIYVERWRSHVMCPVGAAPSGPCGQVLLIGGGALLSKSAISTRTAMLTGTGAFPVAEHPSQVTLMILPMSVGLRNISYPTAWAWVGVRVGPDRLLNGAPFLTHKHLSE